MKKLLVWLIALLFVFGTVASAEVYEVSGTGMGGEVKVNVTIEDGVIKAVEVGENNETPGIGDLAINTLPAKIVEAQSIAVDAASGATITSSAILSAVEDALKQAGLDPEAYKSAPAAEAPAAATREDETADIVVVGGGGAGMTAAIKAHELGKKVILLEKMGMLGGNTAMATTAFFAVGSKTQKEQGIDKTVDDFYAWLMSQGTEQYPMDPEMTRVVAEKSGAALDWMIDIGTDFGRVFNNYFHSPTDGSAPGVAIVAALKNKMDEIGVDYRLENAGVSLVMEDGKVAGVTVTSPDGDYTIHAPAVILAAGGYANNPEMIAEYDKRWEEYGCSSSKGQNGDAIRMAIAVGADVNYIDNIKVNPTVYYLGDNLISMSTLRSNGGLLVNKLGKRFFNESGNYTLTSAAMLEQPDKVAFMVFDATMLKIGLMQQYKDAGYFVEADTIEALAEKLGIDPAGLAAEVARNQGFCAKGVDEDFGRTNLTIKFDNPPFYGVEVHPAAQGTFGGLKVDTAARVIATTGEPIPGLWAAGETAGEGTQGNIPLAENVIFGTLAAEGAAAYVGQ